MKNIVVIAILVISVGKAHAVELVVDVTKVAGMTENEVSAYLGKPSSCGSIKYGMKCQYKKGEMEIVFINGKADWITVEGIDHIPFSKSALNALGLKEKPPSFKNDFVLSWESIQGMRSVSIFQGTSNSDYAYIKVKTE